MPTFRRISDGAITEGRRLLGAGGQGEVWLAHLDGREVAIKIYHQGMATLEQRAILEQLVKSGPPSPSFLWPLALVESGAPISFGYVMALREPQFRSTEDFMARRIVLGFRALMTAAWQLTDSFLKLHTAGLCYRDISFGNVFLDPESGNVRICDNDNVDVDDAPVCGVLGTQRFMAPEVVRREVVPNANTDRYSLAVLLFHLLMGGHPLDGALEAQIRCLDLPALERLYGTQPVYIFDPVNTSNRPIQGRHDNPIVFHKIYPLAILKYFEKSFVEGLHQPLKRVRESEWRNVFARARDSIVICVCGAENFHDSDNTNAKWCCWSCYKSLVMPSRIRIGEKIIMLSVKTLLYNHHIELFTDQEQVIASVTCHPRDPTLLGLTNCTQKTWTITTSEGSTIAVPPGRSAPIRTGNVVNFGPKSGEIRE